MREFVWLTLAVLAGAVGAYALMPNEPIVYPEVIVPARVIIEREPDTVRTFVDRIRTIEVPATVTARAPGGAQEQVQEFCKPIVLAQNDTVESGDAVDPMLLLRSVSYDRRWSIKKDRLFLAGPVNTGDLVAMDYDVRGNWTARATGSTVLVQYPRTSLLYDVWEGGTQLYTAFKIAEGLFGVFN